MLGVQVAVALADASTLLPGAEKRLVAAEEARAEVAEDLVGRLHELGGLHTLDDFAATKGDYKTPVSTSYRGYDIHQMPPNNQGLTALLMLNVLSGFDLGAIDPNGAERLHLEVEAGRLAYRDRDNLLADQDHVAVPVRELLSAAYADRLRAEIDRERAMTDLPHLELPGSDTVYITVVDSDRNAVSFINSTYYSFGSGVVGPKTGVILQNRGTSFRLDPKHPNAIAPGKRPMHTIIPALAMRNGRCEMPFGVMGADYQPMGHAHLITNMVDYGMDVQAAIDHPRMFYEGETTLVERGVPAATVAGLKARGHQVATRDAPWGGGQAIVIDWERGTLIGGSDPRKDGCALGY